MVDIHSKQVILHIYSVKFKPIMISRIIPAVRQGKVPLQVRYDSRYTNGIKKKTPCWIFKILTSGDSSDPVALEKKISDPSLHIWDR